MYICIYKISVWLFEQGEIAVEPTMVAVLISVYQITRAIPVHAPQVFGRLAAILVPRVSVIKEFMYLHNMSVSRHMRGSKEF